MQQYHLYIDLTSTITNVYINISLWKHLNKRESPSFNDVECQQQPSGELLVYYKLLVLFYADDCVILAESAEELQNALNEFQMSCFEWKLTVNVDKTKILIFSKGPMLKTKFYYNNI